MLEDHYDYVRKRIGKSASPQLLSLNRTPGKPPDYRSFYTDELIQRVSEVYAEDIAMLGYDFDSAVATEDTCPWGRFGNPASLARPFTASTA
jgi:hypothetical protein